jgi:hypothetical protein
MLWREDLGSRMRGNGCLCTALPCPASISYKLCMRARWRYWACGVVSNAASDGKLSSMYNRMGVCTLAIAIPLRARKVIKS